MNNSKFLLFKYNETFQPDVAYGQSLPESTSVIDSNTNTIDVAKAMYAKGISGIMAELDKSTNAKSNIENLDPIYVKEFDSIDDAYDFVKTDLSDIINDKFHDFFNDSCNYKSIDDVLAESESEDGCSIYVDNGENRFNLSSTKSRIGFHNAALGNIIYLIKENVI